MGFLKPNVGYHHSVNERKLEGSSMSVLHMRNLDLKQLRVMIREDFNVPLANGSIANDARIRAALPTIELGLEKGAAIILLSHLGRPVEGTADSALSLAPVAAHLSDLLQKPVRFETNWLDGIDIQPGEIVLSENVRFIEGEQANDEILAKKMAELCDVFVMDAFGTAHRAHASTHGIACFAKVACAGPLLIQELDALAAATENAKPPVLAIVGGAKISSKLTILRTLCQKVDYLICGGGIANTFIAANNFDIGQSLVEIDLIEEARAIQALAIENHCEIPIPSDVVVADSLDSTTVRKTSLSAIKAEDMILDIGPETADYYSSLIKKSRTIVWNGPVGVFEIDAFSQGTQSIANAIATHDAYSIVGGGDTIAALEKFNAYDSMSYVSTGGGAFLEYLEGKMLPAIEVLEQRAHEA